MQNSAQILGKEKISTLLARYAMPSIVSMAAMSLYNIVDRAFIGQGVGTLAISGLTITFPLMTLVAAIGTLVGVGSSARISIFLGKRDVATANNILGNAFVLTFILSALLVTVSMIWLDDIIMLFGGTPATLPYARDYLEIVIPASVMTNITYSFSNMMRASGYPAKSMRVMLSGILVNIILDPIFIFWFDWGIKGAAYATVISMAVGTCLAMFHFTNKKNTVHFERHAFRLKWHVLRSIMSIGLAPFLMNAAACGVIVIINKKLGFHGGDLAIGAYGIVGSYAVFIVMCTIGLCQGMQPIVGYNYGAGKTKRVKDTLLLTIKIAMIIMTTGFILAELFPYYFVRVFTSDQDLIGISKTGIRIVFAMFPLVGFQVVISNFFQSIGKARQAIFMSLSRQVIFLIPAFYIFSYLWGVTGVWLAFPVSDFLATLLAGYFILREKRLFYR